MRLIQMGPTVVDDHFPESYYLSLDEAISDLNTVSVDKKND